MANEDPYVLTDEVLGTELIPIYSTLVPDEPLEPEDPLEPDDPLDPDVPEEPLEPDVPDDPLDPDVPEEPLEPDVPEEPELPLVHTRLRYSAIQRLLGPGWAFTTMSAVCRPRWLRPPQ